jgi:YidC/Oxa1 family membrane protein insertase
MERRTQLAMLIIALIIGANFVITAKYQQPKLRAAKARADSLAAVERARQAGAAGATPGGGSPSGTTPESGAPSAGSAPAALAPAAGPFATLAPGTPGGSLVIETPLQRLRISRAGAQLHELSLFQFKVAGKDSLVNLVPERFAEQSKDRSLGLTLHTPEGDLDLSRVRFDPVPGDVADAVAGADSSVRLVRLAHASGSRTFRLRAQAEGGGAILKSFVVDPDRYDFQVQLQMERGPRIPNVDRYTFEWSTGLPVTEETKDDEQSFRASARVGNDVVRHGLRQFGRRTSGTQTAAGTVAWTNMQSKYFMVAMIPEPAQNGSVELQGDHQTQWMAMRFTQPLPWRTGTDTYRVYAGPIVFKTIQDLGVGLESSVELGYRFVRPVSTLMLRFMHFLHGFISNYGIVILILSACIKLVFWPLTERSFRSMRSMQELQPLMEEIKRRYKDQPTEMNRQVMELYKTRKVNPMGSCMPLVIQTPMFVALYSVLRSSIELRNAPFVGWITNLAAPDVLFRLHTELPVIGHNVSLLPLLMGGAMIWQSSLGSAAALPGTPAAQQQQIMKWMMPIMFTFIFYKMPSGLVLYWLVNTLMSVAQQIQINRKLGPSPSLRTAAAAVEGRTPVGAPDRDDRGERGRSPAARSDRVGRKAR